MACPPPHLIQLPALVLFPPHCPVPDPIHTNHHDVGVGSGAEESSIEDPTRAVGIAYFKSAGAK